MNRLSLYYAAVFVFALPGVSGAAHKPNFPYTAVVEGTEVYARSGPGRNYYPTAKLKRGQRVTVHRHDPGGWYMIAPPVNSFSWIRARYVNKQDATHGTVTENNVVVRVGSSFGDDRDIEQVRLNKGTTVEILGEKSFQTNFGAVRMLKIIPPRGEYRWISGRQLVPTDTVARKVNNRNPYHVPTQVKRKEDGSHEIGHPIGNGPVLGGTNHNGGHSTYKPGPFRRDAKRLAAIDTKFRAMVEQDTSSWDLRGIAAEYRKLKDDTSSASIIARINHRLPTVAHYRSIQREYRKTIRLTSAVEQRDAELATGSSHHHHADHIPSHRGMTGRILPAPRRGNPANLPTPAGPRFQQQPTRVTRPPSPQFQPTPQGRPQPRRVSHKFDGAGILRRVEAHGIDAKYALFSPKGDLLTFVKPVPGLPIEKYLDRPMGLIGKRTHRKDLGADYMVVRAMQPVRLKP